MICLKQQLPIIALFGFTRLEMENGRTVRLFTYAMLVKTGFNVNVGRIINPTAVFCSYRKIIIIICLLQIQELIMVFWLGQTLSCPKIR
jgi:hypothetical protein